MTLYRTRLKEPQPADGSAWNDQHRTAAELFAMNPGWTVAQVAEEVGVTTRTIYNWRLKEQFLQLIEYRKAMHREREYRARVAEGQDLILHGTAVCLATLVEAASKGDVAAAYKFLDATGFVAKNKEMGKYLATTTANRIGALDVQDAAARDVGDQPIDINTQPIELDDE